MRETIFRGKTPSDDEYIDSGEWVEGYYTCFNGKEHRIYSGYSETDCGDYYPDWENVIPESVGQYTGLTDINGKRIFEGDIVKGFYYYSDKEQRIFKVVYKESAFFLVEKGGKEYLMFGLTVEVIGNIHDNPELLKDD